MLKAMWNLIKSFFKELCRYLRLHSRVKALEDWVKEQGTVDTEARAEAKRQADELLANVEVRDYAVYLKTGMPGRDTGPYCPSCWRPPNPDTLIKLYTQGYPWQEFDDERHSTFTKRNWICAVCQAHLQLWDD